MPRFKYTAVTQSGEPLSGDFTATDKAGVIAMLRQSGHYPLTIEAVAAGADRVTKQKIRVKPLAGFCQQMSAMLKAGIPIAKTLDILRTQIADKPLRQVLEDVYAKVLQGQSLTDTFGAYADNFPAIFLNMIEAGEASGTLDACLERAGVSFVRSARMNNKVRNAMIYPTVLLVLMLVMVMAMLVYVIPSFQAMYTHNNAELPGITRMMLAASGFVTNRWYVLALIVCFAVCLFLVWRSSDAGRTAFDRSKLRIPVLGGFMEKVYAARFARTLSALCAAGVSLPDALKVAARSVVNRHIEKALYTVVDAVTAGSNLSGPLERADLFPPMVVHMVKVGEESGAIDTLLSQAAEYYDEESDAALAALMSVMEPALIVLMAVIVVPVLLAVIAPVFNLYNTML